MNPLFQNSQKSNNPLTNRPSFQEFAKSMTPKGAEEKVKSMLSSGQITKQDIKNAEATAKRLGLL